jgi:hypothetical protein
MVLERVNKEVLAMLGPPMHGRAGAWLRSRRGAALLTRPARHSEKVGSGRGASRHIAAARSPRGAEQGAASFSHDCCATSAVAAELFGLPIRNAPDSVDLKYKPSMLSASRNGCWSNDDT